MLTYQGASREKVGTSNGFELSATQTDRSIDPALIEIGLRRIGSFGVSCCVVNADDQNAIRIARQLQETSVDSQQDDVLAVAEVSVEGLYDYAAILGCPILVSTREIPDGLNRELTLFEPGKLPVSLFVPRSAYKN